MIDVNVADAIYCSAGICQPLDWWSAAAAWAQAVLTVATFAGTVIYQAVQNGKRDRALKAETESVKKEKRRREIAFARVFAAREMRRWRRAIRTHKATKFETVEDEIASAHVTLQAIRWEGATRELQLLGDVGELFIDLISSVDEVLDSLAHSEERAAEGLTVDQLRAQTTQLWGRLETAITKTLATLDKVHASLS